MFPKIKKFLFYFILFYAVVGFLLLPFLLKPQIITIFEQNTKAKLHIEQIYFNPFLWKVKLSGVQLKDLHGSKLLSFDSLGVDVEVYSLLYGAVHIREFSLKNLHLYPVLDKQKQLNFLQILKNTQSKNKKTSQQSQKIPRIIVDNFHIDNANIAYKDYTHKTPFAFSIKRLGIKVQNIDTADANSSSAKARLYATLGDGGFVNFKSNIKGFEPLKAQGSLDFVASKLYTEWRYLQDILHLEVADGKISFHSRYTFDISDINASHIEDINISLTQLRIKPKNKPKDILNLHSLRISGGDLYPLQNRGKIQQISLNGLKIKAIRTPQGLIDWQYYTKITQNTQGKNSSTKKEKKTASKPLDITIKDINLNKIALMFQDKKIQPQVQSSIDSFDMDIHNLHLDGAKPFVYDANITLNQKAKCSFKGAVAYKVLDIKTYMECRDFDIAHYKPYINTAAKQALQVYDIDLKSLVGGFSADVAVNEENKTTIALVQDANVSLQKFRLKKKSTRENLGTFRRFFVKNAKLDTGKKSLDIKKLTLDHFNLHLTRYKNKKLNIENIVLAKQSKKQKRQNETLQKEKSYNFTLHQFALRNGKITFKDSALPKVQYHTIDRINTTVHNVSSNKSAWIRYTASMRVNSKGRIKLQGKLKQKPLMQQGTLSIAHIALRNLTPYLQQNMNIAIEDGSVSMLATQHYQKRKNHPDLLMQGAFSLDSVFVNDTHDDSLLFSLNKLDMRHFTLELFPNRLYVDNVLVDSFYVSALIDENKTINFAQLMKKQPKKVKKVSKHAEKKTAFPVTIASVKVKNGSAVFQDYSLPIQFKTNIHNLEGELYALSNQPKETTYMKITGEVDKYGSTLLKGSVDSGNPKAYTDININFQNLALHNMSGYSAEFAGYKIDDGKLFLDLGYKVMNSQLQGQNSIIIKKIKLGDEIEDDNVTHLPLGFVIGLLEDSDGIIDIDMPVEGNLDKPDFRYGKLVLQTLGNLIAKAVTSPFKFLASTLGMDGESLESVDFETGRFIITPPQREKLDKLAKIMRKRPKISLRVFGTYAAKGDKYALQKDKLLAKVLKKSGDKNVKNQENAMSTELLEEIYKTNKKGEKLEKIQEELRQQYKNSNEYQRAYQKRLIALDIAMQQISSAELKQLAKQRVQAIQSYLQEEKYIKKSRLFDGKIKLSSVKNGNLVPVKMEIEVIDK